MFPEFSFPTVTKGIASSRAFFYHADVRSKRTPAAHRITAQRRHRHAAVPPEVPRPHRRRGRGSRRRPARRRIARSDRHAGRGHAARLRDRTAGRARDHDGDRRRGAEVRAHRVHARAAGPDRGQLAAGDGVDDGAADGAAQARARDRRRPGDALESDDPGGRAGADARPVRRDAPRIPARCPKKDDDIAFAPVAAQARGSSRGRSPPSG